MLRLCLAALLFSSAQAADSKANDKSQDVSSRLMVHIPHKLFKEEGYEHREALFGTPPYGGSIAQNLYYADDELCDPNVDTKKGYPQRSDGESWVAPFILMVDRGGCTFVKKVRNAQRSGAAGVIIADNACLCSDSDCVAQSATGACETSEPIMADDGSGADISIPSFLIFKKDADLIKDELKANHPVQLEMSWSLPNPDDRVEYDLWSVPTDKISKTFMSSFKPLAKALGEHAYFTPHMYIYDGVRTHCLGNDGENYCYTLCTNNGRYCATDPDNDLDKGISGADVIKESLRRLCIWKHYGETDGIGEVWWNYVEEFQSRCDSPDFFMNEDCVKDAYTHSGVDPERIQRCMDDSGGLEKDAPNSFLDLAIAGQSERGVVVLPSAFVNNAAIRGQLTSSSIFHAVCAGFAEGTAPAICNSCGRCPDAVGCVLTGVCTGSPIPSAGYNSAGTVSTHTFAFWMFFVIAAFGGAGYWHYNRTREDMREQVRGILAEYMPLEDNDGGSPMEFSQKGGTVPLFS